MERWQSASPSAMLSWQLTSYLLSCLWHCMQQAREVVEHSSPRQLEGQAEMGWGRVGQAVGSADGL